jgi:hypothetical protein
MKNSIYTLKFLVLALSISFLTSCKKDTVAFPTQSSAGGTTADFVYGTPSMPVIKDADGILAAVDVHNYRIVTISPFQKEYQYGMAEFTNATGNYTSLTSGGFVTVDTSKLTASNAFLYQSYPTTYSLNLSSNVSWNVSGAGSVPAMTYTLVNGNPVSTLFSDPTSGVSYWKDEWIPTYPKTLHKPLPVVPVPPAVTPPAPNHTDTLRWKHDVHVYDSLDVYYVIYHNDSLRFKTDSLWNETPFAKIPVKHYVANTDTVIFTWHDNSGFNYTRKTPATDSLANFKPNDFLGYPATNLDSDFKMEMNLVNYNSVISGGKKYYYIRMGSYIKYWRTK